MRPTPSRPRELSVPAHTDFMKIRLDKRRSARGQTALGAGEVRRLGLHGIKIMRVGTPDRLDRVGADENDLEVVATFVLALKRSIGNGSLVAVAKLLLSDQALSTQVINKKKILQGHTDRLPVDDQVVVNTGLEAGENVHEVGIGPLPSLVGRHCPSN